MANKRKTFRHDRSGTTSPTLAAELPPSSALYGQKSIDYSFPSLRLLHYYNTLFPFCQHFFQIGICRAVYYTPMCCRTSPYGFDYANSCFARGDTLSFVGGNRSQIPRLRVATLGMTRWVSDITFST